MKNLKEICVIVGILVFAGLCIYIMAWVVNPDPAEAVSSYDRRPNFSRNPVARLAFSQFDWVTGEGHAAENETFQYVNGTIYRVDVIISSVTGNPTVTMTLRDQNGIILIPDALFATLADGTSHYFLAESNLVTQDADFNPVPHNGNVILTVDPSADASGEAQTLTVDFIMYVR